MSVTAVDVCGQRSKSSESELISLTFPTETLPNICTCNTELLQSRHAAVVGLSIPLALMTVIAITFAVVAVVAVVLWKWCGRYKL